MSRRYSPEHKTLVLQTLDKNGGNVVQTAHQIGIPERTLRAWKRENLIQRQPTATEKSVRRQQQYGKLLPPHEEFAAEEAVAAAADNMIEKLLDQMMNDAVALGSRISQNFDKVPPVSQIMAFTRLVDRILKLDARMPRLEPREKTYRLVYQYPDGSMHNVPPWKEEQEDESDEDDDWNIAWRSESENSKLAEG